MCEQKCNLLPQCAICAVQLIPRKNGKYAKTCSTKCKGRLISLSNAPKKAESAKKAAATMRSQIIDGKNAHERRSAKAMKTIEQTGVRAAATKKRLQNINFDEFSNKIKAGMNKRGPDGKTAAERGALAARETMIARGIWVNPADLPEWQKYARRVRYLTRRQPLHLLENIEKRGAVHKGGWHLDHIISVLEGFKKGMPPEFIADIKNLRMIPALENIKKGPRSVTQC